MFCRLLKLLMKLAPLSVTLPIQHVPVSHPFQFPQAIIMPSLPDIYLLSLPWVPDPTNMILKIVCLAVGLTFLSRALSDNSKHLSPLNALSYMGRLWRMSSSRLEAWSFLFRGTKIIQEKFDHVSVSSLTQDVAQMQLTRILFAVQGRTIHRRCP